MSSLSSFVFVRRSDGDSSLCQSAQMQDRDGLSRRSSQTRSSTRRSSSIPPPVPAKDTPPLSPLSPHRPPSRQATYDGRPPSRQGTYSNSHSNSHSSSDPRPPSRQGTYSDLSHSHRRPSSHDRSSSHRSHSQSLSQSHRSSGNSNKHSSSHHSSRSGEQQVQVESPQRSGSTRRAASSSRDQGTVKGRPPNLNMNGSGSSSANGHGNGNGSANGYSNGNGNGHGSTSSTSGSAAMTMHDVRERVAQDVALRAVRRAQLIDGTRVGVVLTLAKHDDEAFLRSVGSHVKRVCLLQAFLFAVATTGNGNGGSGGGREREETSSLLIAGSSQAFVQRAVMLACSKFLSRVEEVYNEGTRWVGVVHDIGASSYDEAALWDVVRKAAQNLTDPRIPPPGARSAAQLLEAARARLERITPNEAYAELQDTTLPVPLLLVDIRPDAQRERHGGIHGSLLIERTLLEWRFDPRSEQRLSIADRYDLRVIVFCQDGDASSLAAAALQDLGLLNATDIVGGFHAWDRAGLPTEMRFYTDEAGTESGLGDAHG